MISELQYDDAKKEIWGASQKQLLLSDQVAVVIENIESLIPINNNEALDAKGQLSRIL